MVFEPFHIKKDIIINDRNVNADWQRSRKYGSIAIDMYANDMEDLLEFWQHGHEIMYISIVWKTRMEKKVWQHRFTKGSFKKYICQ